ncbi:hypothetical protein AKO1_000730, partial [Acrasis kona]
MDSTTFIRLANGALEAFMSTGSYRLPHEASNDYKQVLLLADEILQHLESHPDDPISYQVLSTMIQFDHRTLSNRFDRIWTVLLRLNANQFDAVRLDLILNVTFDVFINVKATFTLIDRLFESLDEKSNRTPLLQFPTFREKFKQCVQKLSPSQIVPFYQMLIDNTLMRID